MKLSIEGRFRKAAQAAFVSGLAVASFSALAQDAATPVVATPAPVIAPDAATPAATAPPPQAAVDTLPIAAFASSGAANSKSEKLVKLEKVEVTGSRIRRVDAEGAQPIVTIDRAAIQASGVTTIGELLQELPSIAGAAVNPRVNNGGGDGASTVSLRGLGTNRTLILLNGRRLVQQDVNSIPLNLVQRVDVLKEGASAIYGSDAIGGVVNFITRKDFKGFELNADYGISNQNDGQRKGLGLSWGTSSDKANIMIGLNYNQQDAVSAADREFSKFATYLSSGAVTRAGSSRNPRGRITLPRNGAGGQYNCPGTGATVTVSRIDGRSGSTQPDYQCYSAARDAFNYQAIGNVILTPQERAGIFTVASYAFADSVEGYTEFFINSTRSAYIVAPLPFDARQDDTIVSKDNGYNPFGIDFGGIAATNPNLLSRFTALGNRTANYQTNVGQLNLGLRGNFSAVPGLANVLQGWNWDAGIGYGRTEQTSDRVGYVFGPALKNALGPTFQRTNGSLGCGTSAANEINGCTPINIFNLSDPTQIAALKSVSANAGSGANKTLKTATFNLTGDAFQLPAGALGLALGGEYRQEILTNQIDFLARSLAPNFNKCYLSQETCSNPTQGELNVTELYGEALLPVLSGITGVKQLNLIGGVRYSDYSSFGSTTNAKIAMEYRPNDTVLVRAGYAAVFRAPTIADLFTPPSISNPSFTDPCTGTKQPVGQNANFDQTCQNVPRDGSFAPATQQVTTTVSGNPNLKPETGHVLTYGIVYDPNWDVLKGVSMSVDYWRYRLKNTIEGLQPGTVTSQCLSSGDPTYCGMISRASDGQVTNIGSPTFNLGNIDTSGVDIGLKYRSPKFTYGRVNSGIDVTFLNKYDRLVNPSDPSSIIHNAGTYTKQDGNYSRTRATGHVGWSNWGIETNFATRFISGYAINGPDGGDPTAAGYVPVLHFGSTWYYDVTLGYKLKQTNTKFLVGVDNLSDEKPPFQYQNNSLNANTDVNTFDTVGRYFFFKITQAF